GLLKRGLSLGDSASRWTIFQTEQHGIRGNRLPFVNQHFDHPTRLQRIKRGDAMLQIDLPETDNALAAGGRRWSLRFVYWMRSRCAMRGVAEKNAGDGRTSYQEKQ